VLLPSTKTQTLHNLAAFRRTEEKGDQVHFYTMRYLLLKRTFSRGRIADESTAGGGEVADFGAPFYSPTNQCHESAGNEEKKEGEKKNTYMG